MHTIKVGDKHYGKFKAFEEAMATLQNKGYIRERSPHPGMYWIGKDLVHVDIVPIPDQIKSLDEMPEAN